MPYILYREIDVSTDGGSKLRPTIRYLTDDGGESRSVLYARVCDTRDVAVVVGSRVSVTRDFTVDWHIMRIRPQTALSIAKHKLKVRGKGLFSLPINTPAVVLADRYEEEGMLEDAELLRRKV